MFSTISVGGTRHKLDSSNSYIGDRHTLIALSLLGQLGQVNGILVTHFGGIDLGGRRQQRK